MRAFTLAFPSAQDAFLKMFVKFSSHCVEGCDSLNKRAPVLGTEERKTKLDRQKSRPRGSYVLLKGDRQKQNKYINGTVY